MWAAPRNRIRGLLAGGAATTAVALAWQAQDAGVAAEHVAAPIARFAAVGVLCTVAHALLFLLLRGPGGSPSACEGGPASSGITCAAASCSP